MGDEDRVEGADEIVEQEVEGRTVPDEASDGSDEDSQQASADAGSDVTDDSSKPVSEEERRREIKRNMAANTVQKKRDKAMLQFDGVPQKGGFTETAAEREARHEAERLKDVPRETSGEGEKAPE